MKLEEILRVSIANKIRLNRKNYKKVINVIRENVT